MSELSDRVAGREREDEARRLAKLAYPDAGHYAPDAYRCEGFRAGYLAAPVPVGEGQEARLRIVKEAMHRAMMRHDSSYVAPASWDEDAARLLAALAAVSGGTEPVAGVRVDDPPNDKKPWPPHSGQRVGPGVLGVLPPIDETGLCYAAGSCDCGKRHKGGAPTLRSLLERAREVIRRGEIRLDADCSPASPLVREIDAALAARSSTDRLEADRKALLMHFIDGDEWHPDWPRYVVDNLSKALRAEVKDTGDWYQATLSLLDRLAAALAVRSTPEEPE